VHDAVNLAWKLGGVLNGWYKPQVLKTYSPERRAIAQHLIKLDKSISALISGHIPNAQKGDANLVLLDVIESSSKFTIGLGVAYEPDGLLNKASRISMVRAGRRAPDVLVRKPGSRLPTRLYELTKNNGKFWIVVFAGEPLRTAGSLKTLRAYLDSPDSFSRHSSNAFDFLTIIAGPGLQPDETLGVDKFGRAYYDVDHSAFARYGISTAKGGILVLRPDGILAFAAELDRGEVVGEYFDDIIPLRVQNGVHTAV
jgi:phenol 2-monooxygenase